MRNSVRALTSRDPGEIGGYRLTGRLGEGGQGVVYLAEDSSGRLVAVKVMHGQLTGSFDREVSAARRVAPFCTAQILDSGTEAQNSRSYGEPQSSRA